MKEVIKSGKKNSAAEKLRALILLDKCIMQSSQNDVFLEYVQNKIMDRLSIMASHCPRDMKVGDVTNFQRRGEFIFGPDE